MNDQNQNENQERVSVGLDQGQTATGQPEPNLGGALVPSELDPRPPMGEGDGPTLLEFEMLKSIVYRLVSESPVGVQTALADAIVSLDYNAKWRDGREEREPRA